MQGFKIFSKKMLFYIMTPSGRQKNIFILCWLNIKFLFGSIIFTLILVSYASASHALDVREKANLNHITIYTEHLAPFQIVKSNGEITGFATDVVRTALNTTSIQYSIEAYPWSFSYQQTLKNKNACVYSLARTIDREQKFNWLDLNIKSTTSFYSLASRNLNLSNIEEAKKFTIAVIRDDITHQFLLRKGFKENKNLYISDTYDSLLKFLEARQQSIDFIILNDDLLKNRVNSAKEFSKYKKNLFIDELRLNFHLGCNLQVPKNAIKLMSDALLSLQADEAFEVIKLKWQTSFTKK